MEEKIDLVDYIRVILKRKWIIIGVTIGTLIIGGIFTFFSPRNYVVSTVIEIGKIERGRITRPNFVDLEGPVQVQEKINQGSYNVIISEKSSLAGIPSIEGSVPKDTNLVVIETKTRDPENGKKVLKALTDIIIEEHEQILKEHKDLISSEIKKEELKLTILEKSKDLPELQYLYAEHLSLIDDLKNTLLKSVSTQVIKQPSASHSQNITMNIVIAGILGLFIGILMVFFQDFLEKNKERLKAN